MRSTGRRGEEGTSGGIVFDYPCAYYIDIENSFDSVVVL